MVDFDQKVKIFKPDLSHSVFQIHSDFGICFFIRNSEIAQTSDFQKNWLLHKSWPKVKIFKKDLSCLVFCVDSNFRIYFFIWESKSAQDLKITNLTHFSEVLAVSKNSSSRNQSLRFIHLVWIPSGLSSKLHQGFSFKERMNSHKCILNLELHWVTNSTSHSCLVPTGLPPTIPV